MTAVELKALRHPSESSRFWATMLVVVPTLVLAIGVVFGTLGLALLPVGAVLCTVWFTTRLVSASFLGNTIKASPENFPTVHEAVQEYKQRFGYRGHVDAYVYEDGSFNAMLVPLLRRKLLLINSDVIANAQSENEVRWLVARFIGALASKHYRFAWLQAVISGLEKLFIFNLLLYPYERAVAKSGDQLGLYAIDGDIESAIRAMQKFMVGGPLGGRVSLAGVLRQHEEIGTSFFGWLAKSLSPFPHVTTRVVNLLGFASERYPGRLERMLSAGDDGTALLVRSVAGVSLTADPAKTLPPPVANAA